MAADAWVVYDHVTEIMADGTLDFDTDSFRVALVTSSYTPSNAHTAWSSISGNEVANGNGYSTHGDAVTVTWTRSSDTTTFDSDDPAWTASGGSITARYAVLVHDADGNGSIAAGDAPIAYSLLDNTPADVTAADGADLTIQLNANGYFQVSRA